MYNGVPQIIVDEYIRLREEIDKLNNDLTDLYSHNNVTDEVIKKIDLCKKYLLSREAELDEHLNGKYLEYINIDANGDHSFKKRKVEDGDWEKYKEILIKE